MNSGTYILSANITDTYTKATNYLSQALIYQSAIDSLLIELNKGIFAGGDLIKFRIFSVDSETLPRSLSSAVVTIFDPNNVQVQTFENITFVKGKYEGSLLLSLSPTFGTWRIEIDVDTSVSFNVLIIKDFF